MSCCPDCGWEEYPDAPYIIGESGDIIPLNMYWDKELKKPMLFESDVQQYGENIYPKIEDEQECTGEYYGYEWTEIHFCPNCQTEFAFSNGTV